MKRTVFTNDNLKQKTESEKENDEQTLQIQRLRNKINQLEKSNFRLQLDNRETQKDMKNLKRKNHSSLGNINYVPKYKPGKENNRTQLSDSKEYHHSKPETWDLYRNGSRGRSGKNLQG